RVLDRLGIARAHFGARVALDLEALTRDAPDRIASLVFQGAIARPEDFLEFRERSLWVQGDAGVVGKSMVSRLHPGTTANVHWLAGYEEFMWSDTPADRTSELGSAILGFLQRIDATAGLGPTSIELSGEEAGVRYEAAGRGTPLVLL